jgi:hypothetical protein
MTAIKSIFVTIESVALLVGSFFLFVQSISYAAMHTHNPLNVTIILNYSSLQAKARDQMKENEGVRK